MKASTFVVMTVIVSCSKMASFIINRIHSLNQDLNTIRNHIHVYSIQMNSAGNNIYFLKLIF